jgi:hypothetical protein
METRIIQFNTSDEIVLTLTEKANGLMVVLVDDKNVSIAIYEFDSEKLKSISRHTPAHTSHAVCEGSHLTSSGE